ncbi:hypothetical protein B0H11DRAFT_1941452 [Mycena galericulata]|nr:hypothetical protein B0H11DRAFT_1941452 [Mycena galericulata]
MAVLTECKSNDTSDHFVNKNNFYASSLVALIVSSILATARAQKPYGEAVEPDFKSVNTQSPMVFVNNLPSNIDNQGLTLGFLMYGISIHSAAIRRAWRKRWCIAELVVAEADYTSL